MEETYRNSDYNFKMRNGAKKKNSNSKKKTPGDNEKQTWISEYKGMNFTSGTW